MDPQISSWILEYFLRNNIPETLIKKLFGVLPTSHCDSRLKRAILLRSIQSELSEASMTETILEILELIAELDRLEGISITQLMKETYCAVAVECTLKFLAASPGNNSEYVNAVDSIWRGRIGSMKASNYNLLFSKELKEWKNDFEVSVCDSQMYKRLSNMNTSRRNALQKAVNSSSRNALQKVSDYLQDAWEKMGLSFLESAAKINRADCGFVSEAESMSSQELGRGGSPPREETGPLPERTCRFHLRSPRRSKTSPLKKYEEKKIRRATKKWTVLEEDKLRAGVEKFGKGNWKLILNYYGDIFENRSAVDLKDKWRNLTRYG